MSTPAAGVWRVTAQQETRERNEATGDFADGVTVYFTTANGHTGSVFVPKSIYTVARARELVGQAATAMDQIGALTGGTAGE